MSTIETKPPVNADNPEEALENAETLGQIRRAKKEWPDEIDEDDALLAAFRLGLRIGLSSGKDSLPQP